MYEEYKGKRSRGQLGLFLESSQKLFDGNATLAVTVLTTLLEIELDNPQYYR